MPKLSGSIQLRGKERSVGVPRKNTAELLRIEERIGQSEAKKESLSRQLETALNRGDHLAGKQTAAKLERLEREITKLYSEWETLV